MAELERNLENRSWLVDRLRAEIVGPDHSGNAIDIVEDGTAFLTWEEYRRPKRQKNGEEILWQDSPVKRYGAGILFPYGITEQVQLASEANTTPESSIDEESSPDIRVDEELEKKVHDDATRTKILADDTENYDVSLANAYRPSAMGLSYFADLSIENERINIEVDCATYRSVKVKVGKPEERDKASTREFWYRVPCYGADGRKPLVSLTVSEISEGGGLIKKWVPSCDGKLEVAILVRKRDGSDVGRKHLITVTLVNRQQKDAGRLTETCYFQCGFRIWGETGRPWILPYPDTSKMMDNILDEEKIKLLLYRERQTFAIGHGCAARWLNETFGRISEIKTESMPTFEMPGTTPDPKNDETGQIIRVSMRKLAGLDPGDDGTKDIEQMADAYQEWISTLDELDERTPAVPSNLKETAKDLIQRCRSCLQRIKEGIAFLKSETATARCAKEAFRLANHAMLIAQLRSSRDIRTPKWEDGRMIWDKPIENPDPSIEHPTKGYWRAFQIAFLMMSVKGICEPSHDDRKIVDLIWFPTGGGKTEAYLGLAAFTIFFNRLARQESSGVDVIMRYTLRLLTAQQFQRAGLLFCAMEYVRRLPGNEKYLGKKEFRIGMWVGGDATPNRRSDAIAALKKLQKNPDAENPFVLLKCPWCNGKFGPSKEESEGGKKGFGRQGKGGKSLKSVYGYHLYRYPGKTSDTVAFRCDDINCEYGFSPIRNDNVPLPIYIIDEDIFDNPPNLIVGTVDKFAMLAWKPQIRSIFGINEHGNHLGLPPTLIIQDELHLISGPLGSMVGAYETVIHELCAERTGKISIYPKIIGSTATISRAEDQIRALYGRETICLFPPSGLEAGDSFFAREDRNEEGILKPGRLYAGILAPAYGSQQTTLSRVFACLLQYPAVMSVKNNDETERDPWWTLISFFNSLRELGGAATLLVSDARDYLRVLIDRHGYPYDKIRQLLNCEELTSRIRSDKIPAAIQKLEIPFGVGKHGYSKDTVETCLASNIIEVGVDIDRLSLMTIAGQPKTTSQYIQVSSRIGRKREAPGLVVVIYNHSKPRDRSHYERFQSYHQRIYAEVEPTSVTPFSPPAVDRALHGILVATVRQLSELKEADSPRPYPLEEDTVMRELIEEIITERVSKVDPAESTYVEKKLKLRLDEWRAWDPSEYGGFGPPPANAPLMHPAGITIPDSWRGHSWPTMSSLRDVDATCEADITTFYNEV